MIEVSKEYVKGYTKTRNLLWEALELIDDLALELTDHGVPIGDDGVYAWPKRLSNRVDRVARKIEGLRDEWHEKGETG